jgi:hypothetical protein
MAQGQLPAVPSTTRYKQAFQAIRRALSDGQLAMLRAQYLAPDHTITATDLADAAGYKNFRGANLQYGKIGTMLREVLDYWDDSTQSSYVLSLFYAPGAVGNSDWLFVMHDEVAQALKELGWFKR